MKHVIIIPCINCGDEFEFDGLSCDCTGECTCDYLPKDPPICSNCSYEEFLFSDGLSDDEEITPTKPF